MGQLHPLQISKINSLTSDSVEIVFAITDDLRSQFKFIAGQYITISAIINNEKVRRAYSLCSDPESTELAIGVKKVEGGKMSTFLIDCIKVGDVLNVLPPRGNFVFDEEKTHIVGICAGSGITPILSMMRLRNSNFQLIYGNKTQDSSMFYEDIKKLNSDNHFLFSREEVEGCIYGRISSETLDRINDLFTADAYFICGPGDMIDEVTDYLLRNGVDKNKIHFERFSIPKNKEESTSEIVDILSNITIILDDEEFEYKLSSKGLAVQFCNCCKL